MISFIILNENYSKSAVIVKFFAENEEDALDQMQEILQEQHITYGICQAQEI